MPHYVCLHAISEVTEGASTPATMSKQHCRVQVERLFRQSPTLLRHCCVLGNNVDRVHVELVSTLPKRRNSRKTSSMLFPNGNSVEATFDFVERIVRLVAIDNVASTLLLVWTGLKARRLL